MPRTTPSPDTGPGADGIRSRRTVRRASRRRARHRRRVYLLCALAAAGALGAAALLAGGPDGADRASAAGGGATSSASAGKGRTQAADAGRHADGRAAPSGKATGGAGATPGARGKGSDPHQSGNGVFHTAHATGKQAGTGTLRRYEVQVEEGTGIAPDEAAREIEGILADRRGWTADGHDAFQLVSQGPLDFVVRIATPDTVDRICGAAGLHTRGEVNCDVGSQVIVNLKRWNQGSPEFPGPLHEYRALIVNHEVGHRIGHGHEACPGAGRPAPAMMQQIDGLHGCVANAWPYDAKGRYLGGPAVP
ncbi:DUF3152 domain-containing protein [Streptomyces sp. PsTaAH-124]|uniref:DUF3152 domain-containing protein n=1 Tax=Streptomyces sp. PsTaAH-124 TaxID=1157638 RepID=UPI000371FEA1|nr:DUF3152 domain-containing protein [Streptomyces sp. PsTaAH-124]